VPQGTEQNIHEHASVVDHIIILFLR